MAQTVLITLTSAGVDTGPFDLYSNIDGFTVPFEDNVPKLDLEAGYTSILVPDSASIVRVQSDNVLCDNFIDLTISTTTTSTTTMAPSCVTLENASSFTVFGNASVSNSGDTLIDGDVGTSVPGNITGFPPGIIIGNEHEGDSESTLAIISILNVINCLSSLPPTGTYVDQITSETVTPGIYTCSGVGFTVSFEVIFDGMGDPDSVFVFQVEQNLSFTPLITISLINGAQPCNIYWIVKDGSVTIDPTLEVVGNILSQGTITFGSQAILTGRALTTGNVVLNENDITICDCSINPCE